MYTIVCSHYCVFCVYRDITNINVYVVIIWIESRLSCISIYNCVFCIYQEISDANVYSVFVMTSST